MPGEWTLVQSGKEWRGCVVTLHIPPLPTGLYLSCVSMCVYVHMCISLYGAYVCCLCGASVYEFTCIIGCNNFV